MDLSMSLALSMAGVPREPSAALDSGVHSPRSGSRATSRVPSRSTSRLQTREPLPRRNMASASTSHTGDDRSDGDVALYHGVSDRPLGWKMRHAKRQPTTKKAPPPNAQTIRRFDGQTGTFVEWDGLKRDPELWFNEGDCLVYLHGPGASQRGPAFRIPLDDLYAANCTPLLERFPARQIQDANDPDCGLYEIYMPSPDSAERGRSFLYHLATRNFFAWMFGRSLVGNHLGEALVGLLNSLSEFRAAEEDNVPEIIEYMVSEGYADMADKPDHALGVLYFAEHFHFRDLWIDAHAHCVGMSDKLYPSPGFKQLSPEATQMIASSRFELHMRLDTCGRMLSTFLSDELSESYVGLHPAAREHLDKFRSFLQMYYVAKLGYYPPQSSQEATGSFPKRVYELMRQEFQNLFEFLVDTRLSAQDSTIATQLDEQGIRVHRDIRNFDSRCEYKPLPHNVPLLPDTPLTEEKSGLRKRMPWIGRSANNMGARLAIVASLAKATNYQRQDLLECTLVRAYRNFEKQCVMEGSSKHERLSQVDARCTRWLLIYALLQVLHHATEVPEQVRGTPDVSYHLGHLVGGHLPWKQGENFDAILQTQDNHTKTEYRRSLILDEPVESPIVPITSNDFDNQGPLEEDTDEDDYPPSIARSRSELRSQSQTSLDHGKHVKSPRKHVVQKALEALDNLPTRKHGSPSKRHAKMNASTDSVGTMHSTTRRFEAFSQGVSPAVGNSDLSWHIGDASNPSRRPSAEESEYSFTSFDGEGAMAWSLRDGHEDFLESPTTSVALSMSRSASNHSAKSKPLSKQTIIEQQEPAWKPSALSMQVSSSNELEPDEVIIVKGSRPQFGSNHVVVEEHDASQGEDESSTEHGDHTTIKRDTESELDKLPAESSIQLEAPPSIDATIRSKSRPRNLDLTGINKSFLESVPSSPGRDPLSPPRIPLRSPRTPKSPLEIAAEYADAVKEVEAAFHKGVADFAQEHNVIVTPVSAVFRGGLLDTPTTTLRGGDGEVSPVSAMSSLPVTPGSPSPRLEIAQQALMVMPSVTVSSS